MLNIFRFTQYLPSLFICHHKFKPKKVDRSLALDQFGYNVDDEPEKAWTPEKFAVFLSRKLNIEKEVSPLYQHIKVTPLNAEVLFTEGLLNDWVVSTATIVDGICTLISSNPTRDRTLMQQRKSFLLGRSRDMLKDVKDSSPLRSLFLNYKDQEIYDILIKYFDAVKNVFWIVAKDKSYITKTVGMQACFDVLKQILLKQVSSKYPSINFKQILEPAGHVDFSDKFFQASGIGRSRIKNSVLISLNYISIDKIKPRDIPYYENVLSGVETDKQIEKMEWEESAEDSLINVLEQSEWNYEDKTVGLYINGDYENLKNSKIIALSIIN
ncbi:MAG: hypothetical protein IPH46_07495 [Bacteroidetes bacterium]|nr:hypothetical protein [Bacteroidota bacterium]